MRPHDHMEHLSRDRFKAVNGAASPTLGLCTEARGEQGTWVPVNHRGLAETQSKEFLTLLFQFGHFERSLIKIVSVLAIEEIQKEEKRK